MATVNQPQPVSETVITERFTRSGRRLWYQLQVIQQPERARACGAGPKCKSWRESCRRLMARPCVYTEGEHRLTAPTASADRRPVDPPPVVELRIFEGKSIEEGKDITFNFNANFFLFTTLEPARQLATPRGMANHAINAPPVLTGVPVAAMAYLDRPREAGYFLFPDLSVRHEGRYRLRFTLYEECKEEKDLDVHVPVEVSLNAFVFRSEVISLPFSVYSAKKFPGLTESTALSRTVAEQGCRVRIRRDVRMRRRDGKEKNYDEEGAYNRRPAPAAPVPRSQTPEPLRDPYEQQRARSVSASSMDRSPMQRRPSASSYTPTQPAPPGGYLSFGNNGPAAGPHFAKPVTPVPSSPLPSPTAASAPYHSQPSPYRHQPPQLPPLPPPKMQQPPPPQQQHQQHQQHQQQQQPQPQPQGPPSSADHGLRRSNSSSSNDLRRLSSSSYSSGQTPALAALPSIMQAHQSRESVSSTVSSGSNNSSNTTRLPSVKQLLNDVPPTPVNGAKRKMDEAFSQSSQQRLHYGQRQVDPHHGPSSQYRSLRDRDLDTPNSGVITYPRADGSHSTWPTHLMSYHDPEPQTPQQYSQHHQPQQYRQYM